MNLNQFLAILRARWWVALLVLVLTVGTTLAVSLLLPKQYTATATVVIDVKPDPIAGHVRGHAVAGLHGHAGRRDPERPRGAARGAQPQARREPAGARRVARSHRRPGRHRSLAGRALQAQPGRAALAREQRHHHQLPRARPAALPPRWPMPSCRPTSTPRSNCASTRRGSTPASSTTAPRKRARRWRRRRPASRPSRRRRHHRHRRAAGRRERAPERAVVAAGGAAGAGRRIRQPPGAGAGCLGRPHPGGAEQPA